MRKPCTNAVVGGVAALIAMSAGATLQPGAEPDPRAVYAELRDPADRLDSAHTPPPPAVGEIQLAEPPRPAPLAETQVRAELPPRPHLRIALGTQAASHVRGPLLDGFARTQDELDLVAQECTDRDAIEFTLVDKADFAIVSGGLSDRDRRAGLRQTQIGCELFALAVPEASPVRSLTRQQVRRALTGEAKTWTELGFGLGELSLVAPRDQALRERAARALILGDAIAAGAALVADDGAVLDSVRENANAIGVVRVQPTGAAAGVRLVHIDWAAPTAEMFGFGTYPFGLPVVVVTAGQPGAAAQQFVQFVNGEDGAELLRHSALLR